VLTMELCRQNASMLTQCLFHRLRKPVTQSDAVRGVNCIPWTITSNFEHVRWEVHTCAQVNNIRHTRHQCLRYEIYE
jgi:hypothetical protein